MIKLDIGNRFFKGHAYIKSDIYIKYDVRFGKVDVTYVIKKKIGLKGKATVSSSEMIGKDYEDDFSIPILDKSIPFGTPIGQKNSSWMKMVNLEVTGELGLQGSVGMELRLWNGDLLAFGGEGALWYGMKVEGAISMDDNSLLKESHELSIHPSLSATLYIESYFINNRKHRIEASVERSFENFSVSLLPEFEFEEKNSGSKLIVSSTVEPICMMEISEVGFAVVHEKTPETPITHKTLPAETIIEEVPTTEYVDVEVTSETIELPKPSSNDVGYYAVPYVVVDGKYYYGENLWVDLGLPSGILWARHNVGAKSAEEYGSYYAWGETEEKDSYTWENYKYTDIYYDTDGISYRYKNIGACISNSSTDVAHIKWGDGARMPTSTECMELLDNCEIKHFSGYSIFTGPNGNSILLPFSGAKHETFIPSLSIIWTSTHYNQVGIDGLGAYAFCWKALSQDAESGVGGINRSVGLNIRPVKDKDSTEDQTGTVG